MDTDGVSLSFTDDGFAILRMLNGENRLSLPFLKSWIKALDEVERNKSCKALITTSEGKFYSNGIDVEWVKKQDEKTSEEFFAGIDNLMWRLMHFPMPTVAAINGHAFAGGAFLAVCHDYRVMRSDRGWISWNEVLVNLRIGESFQELLRLKVPNIAAKRDAVIFARRITAPEAKELGLVDVVTELSNILPEAKKLATSALGPTGIDRSMLSVMKQDIYPRTVFSRKNLNQFSKL